jgi:flavin-dependent dehydrogenase
VTAAGRRPTIDVDVLVVGARCAGASLAMLLARAGVSVLCVDRAEDGSDTLSTHALTRTAVLQLSRWGVLDGVRSAGTPRVTSVTYHYGDDAVTFPVAPDGDVDGLYAPRRTVLDRLLVDAARASGATVLHGTVLRSLGRDATGRVCGALLDGGGQGPFAVRCRFVVGADGARSTVARLAGAVVTDRAAAATATVYTFVPGLPDGAFVNHFAGGASAGLIPTNDGLANVWAGTSADRFRREARHDVPAYFTRSLREAAPDLAASVLDGRPLAPLRIFPGSAGFTRRAFGPGWALAGDAVYFKDPVSAHGITDALVGAELLARSLVAIAGGAPEHGALVDYAAQRMLLTRPMMAGIAALAAGGSDLPAIPRHLRSIARAMRAEWDVVSSLPVVTAAPPARVGAGDWC